MQRLDAALPAAQYWGVTLLADLALAALLLAGGAPTQQALRKTPPAIWSIEGWTVFRWRMGPGDVEAALGAPESPLRGGRLTRVEDSGPKGFYAVWKSSLRVADEPLVVGFWFYDGRLYEVSLSPSEEKLSHWLWNRRVVATLTEKYGIPTETPHGHRWDFGARELRVEMRPGKPPMIFYSEPKASARVAESESARRETEQGDADAASKRKQDEERKKQNPDLDRL